MDLGHWRDHKADPSTKSTCNQLTGEKQTQTLKFFENRPTGRKLAHTRPGTTDRSGKIFGPWQTVGISPGAGRSIDNAYFSKIDHED